MSLRSLARLHPLANHFPPLHGLRALAIVSVLQFHLTMTFRAGGLLAEDHPLSIGSLRIWFGMDLFFVLSGFLIGTLLAPGTNAAPRGGMLRFYARRTIRIVPLYWVVLTALVLLLPPMPALRANLVYEYAYLSNYIRPCFIPWGWSLCVEEHFYLVVPLLAAALSRLPRPSWRIAVLLAL